MEGPQADRPGLTQRLWRRDGGCRPGRARRVRGKPLGNTTPRDRPGLAATLGPGDPVLRVPRRCAPDQASIPHLTRSSLHCCLQRHGIPRLPAVEGDKPNRRKFKPYPIRYCHIDLAEVRTEQGSSLCSSRSTAPASSPLTSFTRKLPPRSRETSCGISSPRCRTRCTPYSPTTVSTSPRPAQADQPCQTSSSQSLRANGSGHTRWNWPAPPPPQIEVNHPLTKSRHPWTNGQVERMTRTIKDATVKQYHYETHNQLRQRLGDFVAAYNNFGRRLGPSNDSRPTKPSAKCESSSPSHSYRPRPTKSRDQHLFFT